MYGTFTFLGNSTPPHRATRPNLDSFCKPLTRREPRHEPARREPARKPSLCPETAIDSCRQQVQRVRAPRPGLAWRLVVVTSAVTAAVNMGVGWRPKRRCSMEPPP